MTISSKTTDFEKLRKLYKGDKAAKAILDHLMGRQRDRRILKVENILYAIHGDESEFSRADVIRVFREFERLGFGSFVVGRWTHPSRFEWSVSMTSVARAAAGIEDRLDEIVDEEELDEEEQLDDGLLQHSFNLRPGLPVIIHLPANLSSSEASRFAEFIKTLPF